MPNNANMATSAAGEHYVAYMLSRMRLVVGLDKAGSPSVDLMACNPENGKTISIQVKTGRKAYNEIGKKGSKKKQWWWRFGKSVASVRSNLYAFVSLEEDEKGKPICQTFIVPSEIAVEMAKKNGPDKTGEYWFCTDAYAVNTSDKIPWLEEWALVAVMVSGDKPKDENG